MGLSDSPESEREDNNDLNEEEDVDVPKMDEAAEQKLVAVLQSGGPDSDAWDAEVLDHLELSDEATLSRLLTIDNTRGLLTEWGGDPVNEPCGLIGLRAMASFPVEIIQSHAKGILTHADEVIDDKYGWHENYYGLWEDVIDTLAEKHCGSALTTFVSETLLPRIREAAKIYAEECTEAKSGRKQKKDGDEEEEEEKHEGEEKEEEEEDEDEGEVCPDLFQGELLDTAARLGEIALKCAAAFEPCSEELSTILEPHWKAIEDCGVYEERLSALRSILSGKGGSQKREATESAEAMQDTKKARSSC